MSFVVFVSTRNAFLPSLVAFVILVYVFISYVMYL